MKQMLNFKSHACAWKRVVWIVLLRVVQTRSLSRLAKLRTPLHLALFVTRLHRHQQMIGLWNLMSLKGKIVLCISLFLIMNVSLLSFAPGRHHAWRECDETNAQSVSRSGSYWSSCLQTIFCWWLFLRDCISAYCKFSASVFIAYTHSHDSDWFPASQLWRRVTSAKTYFYCNFAAIELSIKPRIERSFAIAVLNRALQGYNGRLLHNKRLQAASDWKIWAWWPGVCAWSDSVACLRLSEERSRSGCCTEFTLVCLFNSIHCLPSGHGVCVTDVVNYFGES